MNYNQLRSILQTAYEEDLGFGDLTSSILFPEGDSTGVFTAKANGIIAGVSIIEEGCRLPNEELEVRLKTADGERVEKGDTIATMEGPTAAMLSVERLILNLLQHLSGIATATAEAVIRLNDPDIRICDTRKTLPGLRMLQKYAVRCGGGFNHRYRLDDGVMIKDNHIAAAGSITKAVERIRARTGPMVRIEVETETKEQVLEAVDAGADIIMFDNRSPGEVKEFAALVPEHIITEVSGGIDLDTISSYKNTGVDYISLGFLTHSVDALDISFNLDKRSL